MGPSSDQIERQIVQVRGSMESKIVELRERSQRRVRRVKRGAVIVAGASAALGIALLSGFVVYRLTRRPTARERIRRLLPPLPRLRPRVPPMRVYVGDRQPGEEPSEARWERLAVRMARAAGTAAAAALAPRLLRALAGAARGRAGGQPAAQERQ